MKVGNTATSCVAVGMLACLGGCMSYYVPPLSLNPSKQYAESIRGIANDAPASSRRAVVQERRIPESVMPLGRLTTLEESPRARVKFVSDELPPEASGPGKGIVSDSVPRHTPRREEPLEDTVTNLNDDGLGQGVQVYRSSAPELRDYAGPLSLGDPGESASLWRESRGGGDLWRDSRAWQAMDLITIIIKESDEAKKDADTEVKQKSTIALAISKLFGLENQAKVANDGVTAGLDPTALIDASAQNDFKGEGKAKRKDTLTARMSAMVVEVLPSGIMRIEGQKIVTMSAEEQVMVISGLVRPRDVSSENEVESGKIANMRIDYFGRGTIGEAQHGGWAARALRTLWPF